MHLHTPRPLSNTIYNTKQSTVNIRHYFINRCSEICPPASWGNINPSVPPTRGGRTTDGGPRLCRVFNFVQMTACRRVIASTHFYLLLVSSDVIIKRLIVSSHHNEIFLIQSLRKISFKILIEHQNEKVNLRHF